MQINVKVKPQVLAGFDIIGRPHTRADIMAKVAKVKVNNWRGATVAYNLQKNRKKVALTTKRKKINGKMQSVQVRQVVQPAHWSGHVYVFDDNLLKMAGLRVIQFPRNFLLVPAKKY